MTLANRKCKKYYNENPQKSMFVVFCSKYMRLIFELSKAPRVDVHRKKNAYHIVSYMKSLEKNAYHRNFIKNFMFLMNIFGLIAYFEAFWSIKK